MALPGTLAQAQANTYEAVQGRVVFGGSAELLHRMAPGARAALLRELFATDGHNLGVSYLRLSIGASDLDARVFSYNDLPAGHVITESDIWARRPGSGEISVQHFDRLIGARTLSALKRNQQLKWADLDGVEPQA